MRAAESIPHPESGDLALLRDVAVEAGAIAMRYFRRSQEVWMKTGQSPVSEADYAVDRFLRETLLSARSDYGWLSEETVDTAERLGARRTFVVDPIDGTRGFLEGRDLWCVSLAVVEKGRPIAGVLECPARGETFWAEPGLGAHKNGAPITVRDLGGQPDVAGPKAMIDSLPSPLRETLRRHRYVPSLAYRIAMIADGVLDATFVKPNSRDWDLAAADLILAEAGGTIRDERGCALTYGRRETGHGALVAGSGDLLDAMAAVIAADSQAVPNRDDFN